MSDSEDDYDPSDDKPDVPDGTINAEVDDIIEELEEQETEDVSAEVDVGKDGGTNESELDKEFQENEPVFVDVKHAIEEHQEPAIETRAKRVTVIRGDSRKTCFKLTDYERVKVIGVRATQIAQGNPPLIDGPIDPDPIKVAEAELNAGVCPILIYRYLTDTICEEFSVSELNGFQPYL